MLNPSTTRNRSLALLILFSLFSAVIIKNAWLSDDAFITFRAVDNLISGYGPVWNVAERVQAFTHPLWMLLLSGGYGLTGEIYYTSLALSIVLALAVALLLAGKLAISPNSALLCLLLLTLSKAFVDYSTSGLENSLTHLLLVLYAVLYYKGQPGMRWLLGLAVVAALGAVNRMDALLLFAPVLLFAIYKVRQWRALWVVAVGFIPFWLWEAFSLLYYGFPFPNTAYAKLNTEIPGLELAQQGIFYLLNTISVDPLTLITIGVAITLTVATIYAPRSASPPSPNLPITNYPLPLTNLPVALGIILYLLYVIRIGGDFMTGRFLSAPFVCAVIILARQPLPPLNDIAAMVIFLLITGIGLLNPAQSPLLSNATYDVGVIDNKGIADERGHYFQRYGLLAANRLNRLIEQGRVQGTRDPEIYTHCGIGLRGFSASPYTHIIDFCGLADPLLARLPTIHDPDFRIGHPIRSLPDGYFATLRTGQNMLADARLATYYEKLAVITRGELWSAARWREIWNFNSGQYEYLIDRDRYRYPEMRQSTLADLQRTWGDERDAAATTPLSPKRFMVNHSGIQIDLTQPTSASWLEIGCDCDYFELVYRLDQTEIGRQTVAQSPMRLGDEIFTLVHVPDAIARQSYSTLRILPLVGGERELHYIEPLVGDGVDTAALANLEVEQLIHLYYFIYYQNKAPERMRWLDTLQQQLGQSDAAAWQQVPFDHLIALLYIPAPALQTLVRSHLPNQTVLVDQDQQIKLRWLGFAAEQTQPAEEFQGQRFDLYFEVLEKFDTDFSTWFHIVAQPDGAESIIYDYFPATPTTQWQPGTIVHFSPVIQLAPGDYTLSFGFWTPQVRARLYLEQSEVYWLPLGDHTVIDRDGEK